MTGLLDPASIRRIAAQLDLKPTKQRGQNFVHDANTVRRIVQLAGITSDDVVLEIGPGLGSLTLGLLEAASDVVVVEIEDRLATQLPATVKDRLGDDAVERLHVVNEDALKVRELPGPPPTTVVANLPYNVSVPVILHLLELYETWAKGLVMVQLEVADRLVAAPGSKIYGVPSAKLAWYAAARRVGTVPPKVFWPVPHVESGLVAIERRDPPAGDRVATFRVIDAAFAQRRKMLRAALAPLVGSSAAASQIIEQAGIDPQVRGEMLTVEQFAAIAALLPAATG